MTPMLNEHQLKELSEVFAQAVEQGGFEPLTGEMGVNRHGSWEWVASLRPTDGIPRYVALYLSTIPGESVPERDATALLSVRRAIADEERFDVFDEASTRYPIREGRLPDWEHSDLEELGPPEGMPWQITWRAWIRHKVREAAFFAMGLDFESDTVQRRRTINTL